MTLQSLYLATLALGLLACAALTIFCVVTWARKITGRAAFSAALLSFLMFASLLLIGPGPASFALEVAASMAWITLLLRAIGVAFHNAWSQALRPVSSVFVIAALLTSSMVGYAITAAAEGPEAFFNRGLFIGQVLLAISGLVLLEQVVRNTRDEMRWRLRYLNLGVGTLFTFLLVHNACGLLFNAYLPVLVVVHPAIFVLVAPLIAVGLTKNADGPLKLNLSRRFVFGSGVLTATGGFLLALGVLGYLVRTMDGDWAAALLVLVFLVAVVTSAVVFSHTGVRIRGRRWIEEHLFPSKYDYREEWRRVTEQLTEPSPDYDLPQQVLRALSRVVDSTGGAVWRVSDAGALVPLSQWHTEWKRPWSRQSTQRLIRRFNDEESMIDLVSERQSDPSLLESLPELDDLPGARFLIPLVTSSRTFGIAALKDPPIAPRLDWEDRALLRLVAREAAGFLALREAERELGDSDKLKGYNQMSAFVIHDVKTISSQLSLMLENAQRHQTNPEFIADMIATVDNSVTRMQKLLSQLREDGQAAAASCVDLRSLLEELIERFARQEPAPTLRAPSHSVWVHADASQLSGAIGHIVQNGIDAAASGTCRIPEVSVELVERSHWAEVTVTDSGTGMERDFIDHVLFQPLSSTKGVSGMGVGAYQARTHLRELGGDIQVESWPGRGSRFTLSIPLKDDA